MTAKRAAVVSAIAFVVGMFLASGWGIWACVAVIFYVWGAYLFELHKRFSAYTKKHTFEKFHEEADRKEKKRKKPGVPDTDSMIGAIDEDLYLWGDYDGED